MSPPLLRDHAGGTTQFTFYTCGALQPAAKVTQFTFGFSTWSQPSKESQKSNVRKHFLFFAACSISTETQLSLTLHSMTKIIFVDYDYK